jgi:hypothetical protein
VAEGFPPSALPLADCDIRSSVYPDHAAAAPAAGACRARRQFSRAAVATIPQNHRGIMAERESAIELHQCLLKSIEDYKLLRSFSIYVQPLPALSIVIYSPQPIVCG